MPQIKLNLDKKLFSPAFYPLLLDYSHRWEAYLGSAGSGKSYFITQKLIIRAIKEPIRILVCRRYATTLRQTCFSLFRDVLAKWQILQFVKINESDFRITFPNGSQILFIGLDDETKLLSLNNIGTIWIEEAFEVPQPIVEQLNLRMRGNAAQQQVIMSFNPISKNHWLYGFCQAPPQSFIFHHSTYKDNPFLSADYVRALEELAERNPAKARVYVYGEWGINTDLLVFKNWEIRDFDPVSLATGLEHRVGSDLGFIDPTTIAASLYDRENSIIYVYDEFYKTGCQLDEVYQAFVDMKLTKSKIYMDSAEPRTIDYFRRQGLNAVPCLKGTGSVAARLAFLQNNKIVISPKCVNAIKEFENFSYIKDKSGNITDNTTHEYSHFIDGLGYAYSDIYTKSKLRTLDKQILGL